MCYYPMVDPMKCARLAKYNPTWSPMNAYWINIDHQKQKKISSFDSIQQMENDFNYPANFYGSEMVIFDKS